MSKNVKALITLLLVVLVAPQAYGQHALYVNFAPDSRYSSNGQDSRIVFQLEKRLYSYGHDFGVLAPCADNSTECFAFDFMALHELPNSGVVGSEYAAGDYKFNVVKQVELSLLGLELHVFRVDVTKNGERSNSYLIDPKIGVVAIIVNNFGNKEIPESIFFLQGSVGIFGTK